MLAMPCAGSEHVIGTTAFPMELHLVHYKAVHSSLGEALQEGAFDSLAVLGVFFSVQLGGLVHVPSLDTITAAMENITTANTEIEVRTNIIIILVNNPLNAGDTLPLLRPLTSRPVPLLPVQRQPHHPLL